MNILICDDIESEIANLESVLRTFGFDVTIVSFNNGYNVLDYIRSGAAVDVCFLDIIMPEISGVALANELRRIGFMGRIVFITSSNEFAAESYSVNAFYYLLKPLDTGLVHDVLCRLQNEMQKGDTDGILIKVSRVARLIMYRNISHIEVIKHYVYFHLLCGEELKLYATFTEFASQLLSNPRFVQCHRSYIVNMNEISSVGDKEIIMRDAKRIPVSKSYPAVKKNFTKWMIERDR